MSETTEAFVAKHMNDSPMELYLLRDELHYSAQRYRFRMVRGGEDNLVKIVSIIDVREKAIDTLILQREKTSGMSVNTRLENELRFLSLGPLRGSEAM